MGWIGTANLARCSVRPTKSNPNCMTRYLVSHKNIARYRRGKGRQFRFPMEIHRWAITLFDQISEYDVSIKGEFSIKLNF
jgi:hypothetical protein